MSGNAQVEQIFPLEPQYSNIRKHALTRGGLWLLRSNKNPCGAQIVMHRCQPLLWLCTLELFCFRLGCIGQS